MKARLISSLCEHLVSADCMSGILQDGMVICADEEQVRGFLGKAGL